MKTNGEALLEIAESMALHGVELMSMYRTMSRQVTDDSEETRNAKALMQEAALNALKSASALFIVTDRADRVDQLIEAISMFESGESEGKNVSN